MKWLAFLLPALLFIYSRWFYALTVGDGIRTLFTPFTFYQAGFNGIRWDVSFPKNKFTVLASRGFEGSFFPKSKPFFTPVRPVSTALEVTAVEEDNPVYTFGGHWQTQLGDILTFGATLVNQHQINGREKTTERFLRGSIPYPEMLPPGALIVRFSDDSPGDGADGASVFGVYLRLEGTIGNIDTTITSDPEAPNYESSLTAQVIGGRQVGAHLEADGETFIDYIFELPGDLTPRRAIVRATVANDYRISVSQEHDFFRVLTDRFETRQEGRYTQIPRLNVVNNFQIIRNHQLDDPLTKIDEDDILRTFTMVNKADYTWSRGRLEVLPMVKHLFKRVTRRSKRRPLESWRQLAPILRVNYTVTPKTTIQLGQQGIWLPFFKKGDLRDLLASRFTDNVDKSRSFTSTDFVAMISIQSDYLGHKVSSNLGFQRRERSSQKRQSPGRGIRSFQGSSSTLWLDFKPRMNTNHE